MTSKRKPYKTYTKEFKQEAIRMMESGEKSAAELAMELGIRRNQLYKWKEQFQGKGEQAFLLNNRGQTTVSGLTSTLIFLTGSFQGQVGSRQGQ